MGKVLKKLEPCNLDSQELRVETDMRMRLKMGDRSPCGSDTGFILAGNFSGESPVCINQGPNPLSSASQTVTPLSLGTSRPGTMTSVKGVRWQVGGGLGLRAQPGVLWFRHSPEHVPMGQHFFTDTISWAEGHLPSAACILSPDKHQARVTRLFLDQLLRHWGGETWSRGPDTLIILPVSRFTCSAPSPRGRREHTVSSHRLK